MSDQFVACPKCGARIPLTEALSHEIEESVKSRYLASWKKKEEELLRSMEKKEDEIRLRAERDAKARSTLELQDLQSQLKEKAALLESARNQELELRKRQREIEERERNLHVELERKLDAERVTFREEALIKVSEEYRLREKEKDKQLDDMKKQIDELKRKSELSSQQSQGEVMEIELEALLIRQFRTDAIEPVAKGVRGADIIQRVRDEMGHLCGSIIWESKRTKAWSDSWIQKLKDDQRLAKAEIAVLVSTSLPREITRFGSCDGIWVTDFASVTGLATALRANLIQLAYAQNSQLGKSEKMDLIYKYLSGSEFKQRIEGIVESFKLMKTDLDAERAAMEKIWAKREKQLQRVLINTAGLHGDLHGIIGSSLPEVTLLELPGNGSETDS